MRAKILMNGATALVLALVSSAAVAVPIPYTWKFHGVCMLMCPNVGLTAGGGVPGRLHVLDDGDNVIQDSEILAYRFRLGLPIGTLNQGNSTASTAPGLFITAGQTLTGTLNVSASSGTLFTGSTLSSGPWTFFLSPPTGFSTGTHTWTVPEPDTLLLFGVGLLVVGWAARRKTSESTRKHER